MRPLLLSPHLDDAVFACGDWLADHAGTPVATVFAGLPDPSQPLTDWDRRCGFASPAQGMAARREEDAAALGLLGARPVWLDFLDDQYGSVTKPQADPQALACAIVQLVREFAADTLVLPLGLFHADHHRVHAAALGALGRLPGVQALAYEDALYRAIPGLLQQRLAALLAGGWHATPVKRAARSTSSRKQQAVGCYASQLRAFGDGGWSDVQRPERLWQLSPELPPLR